jgi:microcin C transport system substrate-binding protein
MRPLTFKILFAVSLAISADAEPYTSHALSMFGQGTYGADFKHFDYVRPDAPKGGQLRLAKVGSFDNLNPFTLKGIAAAGTLSIYDKLLVKALDEPFTVYGLLVEEVECPPDRSWVLFTLRKEARWHDGMPITTADVVFTFNILISKGIPFYRSFYADVTKVEALDERRIRFSFSPGANREMPLILGQLRPLPKHYWQGREFGDTTLDPPLGSGPYRIAAVDPGRSIRFERVQDYWARELPTQQGHFNFDTIQYDYYRDTTVAAEALKVGAVDFRIANDAVQWSASYETAPKEGRSLVKEAIPHRAIRGMRGFCFNTRRRKFSDPAVRQALSHAFDFEWTNQQLLHGIYERSASYWNNSEMASSGIPEGLELQVLQEYKDRLPPPLFTQPLALPRTDGRGNVRGNLRRAQKLLKAAGWGVVDNTLVHGTTGEPMTVEFLLLSPSHERIVGPIRENLKRLGVRSRIRTVDSSQYQNRLQSFDYDVIVNYWRQTLSPGNEQRNFWSSAAADFNGSRNYAGIRDPVVDELVERIISATSRQSQVALTRALDRVLLWGHYVIPGWYSHTYRLVYWNDIGHPDPIPPNKLGFPETWWFESPSAATEANATNQLN